MAYRRICNAWPVWRQTCGYLSGRRALPHDRYSFPVPLRIGGWVGLSGWLHTKTVYARIVAHLSTKKASRRVTSLMWLATLPPRHTTTSDYLCVYSSKIALQRCTALEYTDRWILCSELSHTTQLTLRLCPHVGARRKTLIHVGKSIPTLSPKPNPYSNTNSNSTYPTNPTKP